MAIVDYINLGSDLQIVVADADPTTSGIDVPVGSLLVLNDGSASYFKSGATSTQWSQSLLGSGTADKIPKFTGTGVIGNSSITDNGSLISMGILTYANAGIYNNSFYGSSAGLSTASITLAGASATLESPFIFNFGATISTLGVNSNYVSVPILSTTITEGTSGTHNLFSMLGVQSGVLNTGVATTTNAATVYIQGATTGTGTITNNYALWVDDGVTRLDGTAIINGADATTNSVKSAGYFQGSLTTGTPAVGIGTSIGFNTQTAASTYKIGATISTASTNVSSGSEAFDFYLSTMAGGAAAAERLRIRSDGRLKFNTYTSSTSWSGTPVAALMTNSTGDIITQEPVLQVTSLTINQAQINGAFTTPITLVAAPGAGKVIVPSILIFKLNFAAVFATNTTYAFQIGTTTITTAKSFAQTSSIYNIDPVNSLTSVATANLANQPLQWKVQVGNSTGGLGSTISIGCIYTVMTI